MYVMLDDDLPGAVETPKSELVAAWERIQSLEAQVELLQGQLEQERQHNVALVDELKAAQTPKKRNQHRRWWRFWNRR